MRNFLNDKAIDLKQGAIRAMFDRAKYYKDLVNLGIGEPDLDTPKEIIEEGCSSLCSGKTHYTQNAGIIELRKKISDYLKGINIESDPENEIIITTGGMGALALCLLVTISPGDEVMIQDPQWLNYYSQVRFAGGIPIHIPVYEKNDFKLKVKDIERKISSRTKILMINSPNNPTGAVLDYDDLKEIAELAVKYDLLVISDEVYSTLLYDGSVHCSIASLPGMKERTIVINSFSKAFAMTGWRVGFATGNGKIIDKMTRLQENMVSCVAAPSQYGALKALDIIDKSAEMAGIYRRRRDILYEGLNNIEGISCGKPKGSFYLFPNIKSLGKSSEELANDLLEKVGVICIPGSAFGEHGEGYLRISYANSEKNLMEAVRRIKTYVERM